ncbi:MAG: hypothetical protein SFV15_01440 [Polyangiaceae bacterium]|nr:hypothetical protein [Polyangiaceae bacterium]
MFSALLMERSEAQLIPGRARASLRPLWLLAVTLLSCGIYWYFISAGGLSRWPTYGTYHDLLAEGFRSGHLYLPVTPDPALVNAKNPLDRVNFRYWMLDASFYKGKYYVYWGPMPAMLQAAAKSLLQIKRSIGDQYLVMFFMCLGAWFSALMVERVGRRLFGGVSRPLLILGTLTLVCANPTLHAASTASTYTVSIVSAQTCLLGALVAAFDAVWYSGIRRAHHARLALAGLGFGLALACRISVAPAVAIFCCVTAVAGAWTSKQPVRQVLSGSISLGAPVALIASALLYYNKLRFDSWLEFGTNMQTSGVPQIHLSASYLLPNLYSYMLRPGVLSCQFPYVFQVWAMGTDAFPRGYQLPPGYMISEPVIGWLRAVPITWLSPLAFLLAPRPFNLRNLRTRGYVWCLIVFCTLASFTGLIGTGIYSATMRYLSDVTFGLVLVSLLGAYALSSHPLGRRARGLTFSFVSLLALASIVLGVLIGYQGYNGHFRAFNPELDAKFVKLLSVCGNRTPNVPKYRP